MPWEKQYDETKVLEQAMLTFWAQGYAGTSISDLVTATGINRGSLYNAYDDKHDLFMAALRHYDRCHRADYLAEAARANPPRDAILAVFEGAARPLCDETVPGGCLLVNTALEMSPHDPEVAAFVTASLEEVESFFREMIEKARLLGERAGEGPPAALAKTLLGLLLGLRVLARSKQDQSTLQAVVTEARRLLA